MVKIKICGIKTFADINIVNELHPDYIGFVFVKSSKRYITPEIAKLLKKELDKSIKVVGVFVNENIDNIVSLVNYNIIDLIQLHGNEDTNYIKILKNRVNCPIIKTFIIHSEEDVSYVQYSNADYIMLDSGMGTGKSFNHQYIRNINREFFLAGGLNFKNVASAISNYKPYAVDVSSSVETNGIKDKNKMQQFINVIRKEDDIYE